MVDLLLSRDTHVHVVVDIYRLVLQFGRENAGNYVQAVTSF